MKRILFAVTLCVVASSSAHAVLVIEFSPGTGGWSYDGQDRLYINQSILIDRGLSSVSDALVDDGATITLPWSFEVTGAGTAGPYNLIPLGDAELTIEGTQGEYFSGTLATGNLVPVTATSTVAGAYTGPAYDITSYMSTAQGNLLGSDALFEIGAHNPGMLDFDLAFTGAVMGFQNMLENNLPGEGNFSGSISIIPEPATIIMLGIGALTLLRRQE